MIDNETNDTSVNKVPGEGTTEPQMDKLIVPDVKDVPEKKAPEKKAPVKKVPAKGATAKEATAKEATAKEATAKEATAKSDIDKLMKPYLAAYPDNKVFHISSDGQVFLQGNKNDAENHQKHIDQKNSLTIYKA